MGYILQRYCRNKIQTCQATNLRAAGGQSSDSESSIRRQERDRRLTFMVAVMYISFLAIWTPYACTSLMETAGYQPHSPLGYTLLAGEMKSVWQLTSHDFYTLVSTMLVKSTVCINPIIYFGLNPQFRGEILKMLKMFDEPMRAV